MRDLAVVYVRRRTPAERELVRIELDRVDAPEDALARKLIKASYARAAANLEFAEARRRR